MKEATRKIVTIGGGSGHYVLLSGLRDVPHTDVTAIVSMIDSGGSSGRLRDEFGILPPGDILKCILALSPLRDSAAELLLKRFQQNPKLNGHNAGNLLLAMLAGYSSFTEAVAALSEILSIRGTVLPVSRDKATLVARLGNGERIFGEEAVGKRENRGKQKIEELFLVPHHNETIHAYPAALQAIKEAEYIVIGPGDLFTSILPNLIVPGVKEALLETKATILYMLNIMTTPGETRDFQAYDFVRVLQHYLGTQVQHVIYNNERPGTEVLKHYEKEYAKYVEIDQSAAQWKDHTIHAHDMITVSKGIVRHDPAKLAHILKQVMALT